MFLSGCFGYVLNLLLMILRVPKTSKSTCDRNFVQLTRKPLFASSEHPFYSSGASCQSLNFQVKPGSFFRMISIMCLGHWICSSLAPDWIRNVNIHSSEPLPRNHQIEIVLQNNWFPLASWRSHCQWLFKRPCQSSPATIGPKKAWAAQAYRGCK